MEWATYVLARLHCKTAPSFLSIYHCVRPRGELGRTDAAFSECMLSNNLVVTLLWKSDHKHQIGIILKEQNNIFELSPSPIQYWLHQYETNIDLGEGEEGMISKNFCEPLKLRKTQNVSVFLDLIEGQWSKNVCFLKLFWKLQIALALQLTCIRKNLLEAISGC